MAIDVLKCYQTEPQSRDYVLPGMTPGTVGSIVSPGGQGKSILALILAHLVAGGVDLLDLGTFPIGKVVYLSAEDNEDIIHERLYHIGSKLNTRQRESCSEWIYIEDLTKVTPDLINGELAEEWRKEVERLASQSCLLLLDTLRSFHSADENNSQAMAILIGHLRAIAARTGCAIIFLHHSSKALAVSGQGDLQQASRGSSVLTDNIRWQSYLVGMTDEESHKLTEENGHPIMDDRGYYVKFGISKQNYGFPFTEKWFKRGRGGILEPIQLRPVMKLATKEGSRKEAVNGHHHD
jgi:RecA-family ATPase